MLDVFDIGNVGEHIDIWREVGVSCKKCFGHSSCAYIVVMYGWQSSL